MKLSFGDTIRGKRVKLGVSMIRVAKDAGIDKGYLSKIEVHNLIPSPSIVSKLAESLKLAEFSLLSMAAGNKSKQIKLEYVNYFHDKLK